MRNPFMLKKTHDQAVTQLEEDSKLAYYNGAKETAERVRQWAVDANYNLFHADDSRLRAQVTATLQDAVGRFSPTRLTPRGKES